VGRTRLPGETRETPAHLPPMILKGDYPPAGGDSSSPTASEADGTWENPERCGPVSYLSSIHSRDNSRTLSMSSVLLYTATDILRTPLRMEIPTPFSVRYSYRVFMAGSSAL